MQLIFFCVLFLIHATNQETCGLASAETFSPWIADDYGRLVFPIYNSEPLNVRPADNANLSLNATGPCTFDWIWKNFICYGNLDHDFIHFLSLTQIKNFVVFDYKVGTGITSKRKTPIEIMDDSYRLTGEILSTAIGVGMRISVDIRPNENYDGFIVEGDAYSNELRVGWQISGKIDLFQTEDSLLFQGNIKTIEEDGWVFTANAYFSPEDWSAKIDGTVNADFFLAPLHFFGNLLTDTLSDSTWKVTGETVVKPLLVIWTVQGTLTPTVNEQITIPRGTFRGSKIKHILFQTSTFMGDFDKDALQGIRELETITFLDSKLEEIPRLDFLFNNLTNLKAVYIEGSSMPDVSFGFYKTLPSLELLSFKSSGPLQLDGNSFQWLKGSNLTYLNFQDCNIKIKSKSGGILEPIGATLKYLDLSYTSLIDSASLEAMLKGLQVTHLSLAGLQLKNVPRAALEYVSNSTKFLTFRGNIFHKVPEENMFSVIFDFPLMPQLEELDLKRCQINYIETGVFDQLPALKRLYLSYNDIENIQEGWYGLTPSVVHIDLSWNKLNVFSSPITELSIKPGDGFKVLNGLQIIDLSNAVFTYLSDIVKSLPNTTKELSLCNTALPSKAVLEDLQLPQLINLDLSGSPEIEFGSTETIKFLNSLSNLTQLHARRNRITGAFFNSIQDFVTSRNLSFFIEPLECINLSENNIKVLNQYSFAYFPNLKKIDLTANSITAWSASLSLGPNLKKIHLSDNKIETITDAMMTDLSRLKELEIGRNPYQCDCGIEKLANALNQQGGLCAKKINSNRRVFQIKLRKPRSIENCVNITDWNNSYDFYCYKENGDDMTLIRNLNSSGLCEIKDKITPEQVEADLNLLYIITAVSLVIGMIIAFIYWKWWEIRILTRAVRNAAILTFLDRKEEDATTIQYSVFVSYSDKDRPWVLQNLLPRLEEWSDVNVCLHERDFQVGMSIMENITNCMERSRNLVLVLSQAFVMSQWCQFELHLAQHRFIESRKDRLVLVLLESIPSYKKPKSLRYLMRTNTYLEWPGNEKKSEEVDRFWDRLFRSLSKDVNP